MKSLKDLIFIAAEKLFKAGQVNAIDFMTNPTKTTSCTHWACIAGLFISLTFLHVAKAEDVFVTSYHGAAAGTDLMPCPPSCHSGISAVSTSGASTSSASTCTPAPVVPASDRRVIFGIAPTDSATGNPTFWSVQPLDGTYHSSTANKDYNFTKLQHPGGLYKIYVTRGSGTTTHSTNLVVAATIDQGQLLDTNGVAKTSIVFPFTRSSAVNTWIPIGYLTNTTESPTVTFTYVSGNVDSSANRWNMDAVYFQYIDVCSPNGVPVAAQVNVAGPLAAGQSFATVTGVTSGATNVSVFADNVIIGTTNKAAPGFTNSTVVVSTTRPLAVGDDMTASQSVNGCTSTLPGSGIPVGGGANPSIAVMISCSKNAALTGPAGANGSAGSGFPYIVGASHTIASFNTAPLPGVVLQPGTCWQAATFSIANDPCIDMNSDSGVANDTNPYCALDALIFSMDALDSGPYDIYIGRIVNGDTVIEDFQSYAVGTSSTFAPATSSATFAPSSVYLANTVSTTISTNHAYTGTKSCRIQWQWVNNSNQRWARIIANGAGGGKVNPQLNTTNPVTIYYLVLPVGSNTDSMRFSSAPADQSKAVGQTAVFNVGVTGSGTFSYQWSKAGNNLADGGNISGSTTSALTLSSLALTDSGVYTVTVNQQGGANCFGSVQAALTVSQSVPPSALSFSWASPTLTLNWSAGVLQSNVNILSTGNVWNDVPNASSPYPVTPSGTQTYFRVRGQ